MVKILFVCLGNICRSPSGEGVMYHLLRRDGLEDKIYCDSAGTAGFHSGERADERMRSHAEKRGYQLLSLSRQVELDDFEEFDYIMAMDSSNYRDLVSICPKKEYIPKVKEFIKYTDFKEAGVPDPYYDGEDGFEYVLDIIEQGCENLLKEAKSKLNE